MSATATIRVPKETRDSLAELAELQGISISRLLTKFATREHLLATFAAERAATEHDLADPNATSEYELWGQAETDDFE